MKKTSGVLRRVVILAAFAWAYDHFVINGSLYTWSPTIRDLLTWLLYAAVAWGIITLFADRVGQGTNPREGNNNEPK